MILDTIHAFSRRLCVLAIRIVLSKLVKGKWLPENQQKRFDFPTQGRISVLGMAPHTFPRSVHECIGYMPQLFVLYPNLTVQQTLNFMASIYGLGATFHYKRMEQVLALVEGT
jgi:hypothetical protein